MRLYLTLKKGGIIAIRVEAKTKEMFEKILDKLRTVPVIKWDKSIKKYVSNIHHIDFIYEICRKNGYEVYVSEIIDEYHERFKLKSERIKKARTNTEFSCSIWTDNPELKVRPHQAMAINVTLTAGRYLNGDDMGLGKTIIATGVICKALEMGNKKALVVVMNRLKYQWKEEILKFTKLINEEISIIDVTAKFKCPISLTDTLRLNRFPCKICDLKEQCRLDRDDPGIKWRKQLKEGKIVICNYESLDKMKVQIIKSKFDIIIFDEVTEVKNHKSLSAKAAIKICNSLSFDSFVLAMSGTFIENKLEELWVPFTLIDKRILGEFYNFKNRYLISDYWHNIIGTRNEKQLKKIVDKYIIRREVQEVWKDRPQLIEINKMIDMTEIQKQFYKDAKKGVLKELEDKNMQKKINSSDIGPLLNYLMQICDTPECIDNSMKNQSAKLDTLKEILKNEIHPRHKIIIFSFFGNIVVPIIKREIESWKCGGCLTITGNTKAADGELRKKKFAKDKDIRFLICSDATSYGANLQCATYVINFDLPWNPARVAQRIARAYRTGQTQTVTAINLVMKDSIEEKILEVIGNKRQLFSKFLGGKSTKTKSLGLKELLAILKGA